MNEYFLDLSASCVKQLEDRALQTLSAEMDVHVVLKGQRLYVRADDASSAIAVTCKMLTGLKRLGTRLSAAQADRACDWSAMLSMLTELNGAPIACSSAVSEADVAHAFNVFSKGRDDSDLALREFALFSWRWLSRA